MQLTLESHNTGEVVVIRCRGRIVSSGEEARFLQNELGKLTELTKKAVINLAEVTYLDSGGLGTLVRLLGVLRAARGDLKLCQVPPFVLRILEVTNLKPVFRPYVSETDAIEAFRVHPRAANETLQASSNRIVCLDSSLELLAYLRVLLQRSGYEVFTTQFPSDALTFVMGAPTSIVICGPGMGSNHAAIEKFRQGAPTVRLLHLPPDFSMSEADQSGPDLIDRVRSLLVSSS
ncbi:MAG TPA: STAS domain-containing protein [Candidatus Acidoferrales bacterium]|nr:STAS domain-containing protein [Candidatus Acidoferrales bacterium]